MMHSNPKTMAELCEYVGLTDKEYFSLKHSQKSSFPKVRKFTHHAMWRETSKQYSVEQLKQIKKCTI